MQSDDDQSPSLCAILFTLENTADRYYHSSLSITFSCTHLYCCLQPRWYFFSYCFCALCPLTEMKEGSEKKDHLSITTDTLSLYTACLTSLLLLLFKQEGNPTYEGFCV